MTDQLFLLIVLGMAILYCVSPLPNVLGKQLASAFVLLLCVVWAIAPAVGLT